MRACLVISGFLALLLVGSYSFSRKRLPRPEWNRVVERASEVWRTILGDDFWNQGTSR